MPQTVQLIPATQVDIPTLSQISALAFSSDTHTQLNCLVKKNEFDMGPALESWIALPRERCVVMKAVLPAGDGERDGETVGWACWAFKGLRREEISGEAEYLEGETGTKEEESKQATPRASPTPTEDELAEHEASLLTVRTSPSQSPIQKLNAITNSSMSFWQSHLSHLSPAFPPGSPIPKHLILIAINILPTYQGQGIGSSLISYGTKIADHHEAYCWVSSSDGGYKAFEKAGFEEVGRLELELDDFAFSSLAGVGEEDEEQTKKVRNAEREDGMWGTYVWRYMRRELRGSK